jgi:hypothetical protein
MFNAIPADVECSLDLFLEIFEVYSRGSCATKHKKKKNVLLILKNLFG